MKPYFKTLNSYFVKQGEKFPYCKFFEPWYCPITKKKIPGFEVFSDVQVEADEFEPAVTVQPDWEDYMESSLFE